MARRGVVMSAVVVLLLAGLALAQPPQGPGGGGFGKGGPGMGGPGMGGGFGFGGPGMQATLMSLVGIPDVQKELGVSDEQKKAVAELAAETQKQMRSSMAGFDFEKFQNMSQEERQKFIADSRKKSEETTKAAEEKLRKILDEKQMARLNQLRLQREGIAALSRPEVAKELGLSEDQVAKIRKLQQQGRPGFGGPGAKGGPGGPGGDFREMMAQMQKQREKLQADVLAVLTEEQRAKWTEMKGKEFKFPQPKFPAGFGPGGPGGFGGGKGGERTRPPVKQREE